MTYVLSQHARNARVEVGPRLGLGRSTAQTTSDLLEQESDPRFPWMAGTVPGKLSPGLRLCISSGSQSGNSASHSILGHTWVSPHLLHSPCQFREEPQGGNSSGGWTKPRSFYSNPGPQVGLWTSVQLSELGVSSREGPLHPQI